MDNPRLTQFDTSRFEVYSPYGTVVLSKYIGNDEEVIIPEGIETIAENAFDYKNENVRHIMLPSTIKELCENQFYGFSALETVDISKTTFDTIPEMCFFCSSISEFTVSESIRRIEREAFFNCPNLKRIILNKYCHIDPRAFGDRNSVGFEKSKYAVIYYPEDYEYLEELDSIPTEIKKSCLSEAKSKGGCYVATCVYGSYDCPQVWTLRRYRDYSLALTWYGRLFINVYYAISPTIVRWFGDHSWFHKIFRKHLDCLVKKLNSSGIQDTYYND